MYGKVGVQDLADGVSAAVQIDPTGAVVVNGKTGNDTYQVARIDAATHSLQTIEYEHHEIHAGSHYFVHSFLDVAGANDVLDFTWQMPDTTKWIHWNWDLFTEKAGTWYVYENAVFTQALANTITPLNSDRNSSNSSATTMKYELQADLATANADTDISTATVIASGKLGDNKSGGADGRGNEIIMKQGGLYCLRWVATSAGYVNFNMNWYEHTNKGP